MFWQKKKIFFAGCTSLCWLLSKSASASLLTISVVSFNNSYYTQAVSLITALLLLDPFTLTLSIQVCFANINILDKCQKATTGPTVCTVWPFGSIVQFLDIDDKGANIYYNLC